MSAEICQKLVESLKKRGFEAEYAATRGDAVSLVLAEAVNAMSVGWGGSETVKELGLREAMADAGKDIRDHQLEMDLFLLSANAVTLDGRIVNIDGRGNRVAASIAGPKRVVYLIGRNKIVDGGIDAAIDRVKRFACAPNCRRLGKRTPCAETGVCADCDSPDRICKVMAVFDRKPTGISAKVIVVDSDLGY
jgi:L-lactate utilization protein LutB